MARTGRQKCARTACGEIGTQKHRDLPGLYCRPCGRLINAACGAQLVDMSKPKREPAPKCAACGRSLPWLGGDDRSKTRGRQGDGLVCGVKCGWRLAMMIVQAVPGVIELLPPKWRHKGAPTTTSLEWLGENADGAP